jgi:hypothetical protein
MPQGTNETVDAEQQQSPAQAALRSLSAPTRVPVDDLLPADSPRLSGEDADHARVLAEVEGDLPPIIVHRPSMRVIDGMHRLWAARMRGQSAVAVRFFDGSEKLAFVLSVEANIRHGLPLSLADREAAAVRIVRSHPEWSDRAIAAATGLAAKTVSAIRQREGAGGDTVRVGRDGRLRPLNAADGRRLASQIIVERPETSLRQIARIAGISPATARDVRQRVDRGDDPVPHRQRPAEAGAPVPTPTSVARTMLTRQGPIRDRFELLRNLCRDPSLRFTESGRSLLRWLEPRVAATDGWNDLISNIPPHCTYMVADLARSCANEWLEFADRLNERTQISG